MSTLDQSALDAGIPALERDTAPLSARAGQQAQSTFEAVVRITTELFGEPEVFQDSDPEFSDDEYTVLAVRTADDATAIVAKETEWVRRVNEVARNSGFRLSIRPNE